MNRSALIKFMGKLLFPRQQPWDQYARTSRLFWAITTGVVAGVVLYVVLIMLNRHR